MLRIKIAFLLWLSAYLTGCGTAGSGRKAGGTTALATDLAANLSETRFSDIRMLQRQVAREKSVAVEIVFTGGVSHYGDAQDGIEALALEAVLNGSGQEIQAAELQRRLRTYGAQVSYRVGLEHSSITLHCTERHFAQAWQALMHVVLFPAFDTTEFAATRARYLERVNQATTDPVQVAAQQALAALLPMHAYGRSPEGTPESVTSLTLDSVQAHYGRMLYKHRLCVTSAGSLNPLKVQREMIGTLSMIGTDKNYVAPTVAELKTVLPTAPVFVPAELPETLARGIVALPPVGTREYAAAELALALLVSRLDDDLCQRRHLSCTVTGGVLPLTQPFGSIQFTSKVPNPTLRAAMENRKGILITGFGADEVAQKRAYILTRLYGSLQNSQGQAALLADAYAKPDWKAHLSNIALLQIVKPEEVNAAARKYFPQLRWCVVGNTGSVGRGVFEQK